MCVCVFLTHNQCNSTNTDLFCMCIHKWIFDFSWRLERKEPVDLCMLAAGIQRMKIAQHTCQDYQMEKGRQTDTSRVQRKLNWWLQLCCRMCIPQVPGIWWLSATSWRLLKFSCQKSISNVGGEQWKHKQITGQWVQVELQGGKFP